MVGPAKSAEILAWLVETQQPFVFVRIGDGDLCCAFEVPGYGTGLANTNGEISNPDIARRQREAFKTIAGMPTAVYYGGFTYPYAAAGLEERWQDVKRLFAGCRPLHVDALHLHRLDESLLRFYRAAAADTRHKMYVAPLNLAAGAGMLRATHLPVLEYGASGHIDATVEQALEQEPEVVFVSAGYSTKPIIAALAAARPAGTYIDLGSALHPLFVGQTRRGQAPTDEARAFFEELL